MSAHGNAGDVESTSSYLASSMKGESVLQTQERESLQSLITQPQEEEEEDDDDDDKETELLPSSLLPTFQPKTIFEPFRIKSVEHIQHTTQYQREVAIEQAYYNPFKLHSNMVMIDLLTDSGTGAMSKNQWSSLVLGDESYAGSPSFYKFESVVRRITGGFQHVLPTHQGRAAERILFSSIPLQPNDIVLNNSHFDTTRANIENHAAHAINILDVSSLSSAADEGIRDDDDEQQFLFKGNIDLIQLEKYLKASLIQIEDDDDCNNEDKKDDGNDAHGVKTLAQNNGTSEAQIHVPLVMITVTNNSGGGQPVSMANIRSASEICHRYNVPLFLDACRFAENVYFIKQRESGYNDKSPLEICQEMFSYVDGCTMSCKKDGLANIGGFLGIKGRRPRRSDDDNSNDGSDVELPILDGFVERATNNLILTEGYVTYGGLAGYDLEAIATGLEEVLNENYLKYRIQSIQYLGNILVKAGIPIIEPTGGHAIYIDAKSFLSHIPIEEYPAWTLSLVLYLIGGIRSVEVGSVMFGQQAENELGTSARRGFIF